VNEIHPPDETEIQMFSSPVILSIIISVFAICVLSIVVAIKYGQDCPDDWDEPDSWEGYDGE
jgi:hypothetical protein